MAEDAQTEDNDEAYDPFAPGSLGDLIPWPEDSDAWPNIPAENALDLFLGWCENRGVELWDHQEEALLGLAAGDHVILGTPTGSGKSLVALGMCFMSVCTDRRAYYTAPIKALVSEKFFRMVSFFGRENVGMITGDSAINSDAPIICCTAEILANDALRLGEDADIGCVAMDEFHFFGDPDRGWAWQVPLLTLPHAQFLLMSATLGDTTAIARTIRRQTGADVDTIADAPRPVPLTYEFVDTNLEGTVELALRAGDAPLYIVHFAQDAALKSAQSLSSFGISTKEQREQIKEAMKGTLFTTAFGKTLRRLLLSGVGVHHAGMLPRYRLLVEKLAQQGLLPVICGTDTLGVGINVPIHTVVLTALAKYDGVKMRRLNAREFHQIAGRAGRAGFDTEGRVIAEATEYDIEKARALAKAGGDPKKARKAHAKQPPKGFVGWNEKTFTRLIETVPEALRPRLRITHSMVLAEVMQGGDAHARIRKLIADSMQTDEQKVRLYERAEEIFVTLERAGVIERVPVGAEPPSGERKRTARTVELELPEAADADDDVEGEDGAAVAEDAAREAEAVPAADDTDEAPLAAEADDSAETPAPVAVPAGAWDWYLTVDLPEDFALDQPLSPFLLAALELLDPESDDYALDAISMAEATLEDPWQILRAQERQAKDAAMAAMKAEGIGYDERIDRLQEVTYPKPLEELLGQAFRMYCEQVPWARDYELSPKSILRDMVETASDFKGYIARLGIARSEGLLLRYLSDAYRVLDRTIPDAKKDERLRDITAWLGLVVRSVDSSLVDEWTGIGTGEGEGAGAAAPQAKQAVVADRRALTVLVRNALFARVRLAAQDKARELGELDSDWGWGTARWQAALGAYFEAHDEVILDADARSMQFLDIDEGAEEAEHRWHVRQTFSDPEGDRDFGIDADVDLDETQETGSVVFEHYRVGFVEELNA